jgi:hypothetical protein
MNYMMPRGLPQSMINQNALQLQPMQSGGISPAQGFSPYGMIAGAAGDVLQQVGNPDSPNYGTSIGGGVLSGAASGAAIGTIVPGIGTVFGGVLGGATGGLKGLFGSSRKDKELRAREKAIRQQQELQQKQLFTQQRLNEYYNQPNPQYNYKCGGKLIKSYPDGGLLGRSIISPKLQAGAMYNALKQPADSALLSQYPQLSEIAANAPSDYAARRSYADSVALANPGMYIKPEEVLTQSQASAIKNARQNLSNYSTVDVTGTGPESEAYGARNYLLPAGAIRALYRPDSTLIDAYNVRYNPSSDQFYRDTLSTEEEAMVPEKYGTYAAGGGLSRSKDYGSKNKPYPSVSSSDFAGGGRSYPIPTKADAIDALRLAGLHHRPDVKAKVYAKYPGLKKAYGGQLPQWLYEARGNAMKNSEYNPKDMAYGGSIKIAPSKRGTFKAQATRMGMGVQEAASHILANKDNYSSAMVKKANFAKNFAKENGGMINSYSKGGKMNFKSKGAYQKWLAYGHMHGQFAKTPGHQKVSIGGKSHRVKHANGGNIEETRYNPNITYYPTGGSHEQNANGGIMLGNKGSVEQGEVRYGDYIFSDRF